jgi:hypothetical protein
MTKRPLIERFAEKIQLNEQTGCWDWTAAHHEKGYGRIGINYKHHRAHRVAFSLFVGPIPDGMMVCHHCDNPGCCNPDHLFTGTTADNFRDMESKGRGSRKGLYLNGCHGNFKHGEANPRAKLTNSQVLEIRRLVAGGMKQRAVADMFAISRQNVSEICTRRSWNTD